MKRKTLSLSVGLLLLALLVPCGALVFGQSAPILLNFQGRLTNSVGAPITAATSIQLTLLRDGTASEAVSMGTIVYQETASVTPDSNGVFNTVIGDGIAAPGQTLVAEDFDTGGVALFVEMVIGTETLLPRTQLLSAAFALESLQLGGQSRARISGRLTPVRLEWVGVETVNVLTRIDPEITIQMNDGLYYRHSGPLTWSFNPVNRAGSTEGLGLDTGAEAIGTWYYLYAVPHSTNVGDFTVVASVTPPPMVDVGPTGFSTFKYLGAIRNAPGGNIREFRQVGREFRYLGDIRVGFASSPPVEADSSLLAQSFATGSFPTTFSSGVISVQAAIPRTAVRFPMWLDIDFDANDVFGIKTSVDGTRNRNILNNQDGGNDMRQRAIYQSVDPDSATFMIASDSPQNTGIDMGLIALGFIDDYVDP